MTRFDVVQLTLFAGVAIFAQDQPLGAELYSFRLPGLLGVLRDGPLFVFDRRRHRPVQFQDIQLGDQSLARG
ncbi:MAG: hypothetical protein JWP89_4290 [Schlesneria sp.]|nr:hypothetical protein [Schlesneria sp.]